MLLPHITLDSSHTEGSCRVDFLLVWVVCRVLLVVRPTPEWMHDLDAQMATGGPDILPCISLLRLVRITHSSPGPDRAGQQS